MTTMKKAGLRQTLALAIGSIPREGSWGARSGCATRRVGPVAGRACGGSAPWRVGTGLLMRRAVYVFCPYMVEKQLVHH